MTGIEVIPATATATLSATVAHDQVGEFVGRALGEVMAALLAQGRQPSGMPFARYDLVDEGFAIEAGFPCDGPIEPVGDVHPSDLPGGEVVTTMHVGPYQEVAGAYRALEAWMAENGYQPMGAPWESYLDGPEVAEPRTIVTWPCRKAG